MVELARCTCLEGKTPEFNALKNRIRYAPFFSVLLLRLMLVLSCIEHVLNIGTQGFLQVISSPEPELDPNDPNALPPPPPQLDTPNHCDLIKLARTISVKVSSRTFATSTLYLSCYQARSSPKRRQIFVVLQMQDDLHGNQLLLLKNDTATRWSSTHFMITRLSDRREVNPYLDFYVSFR